MSTSPTHGPFDVWAPNPQRVRLIVDGDGGGLVEMARGDDGWWTPAEALPARGIDPFGALYGYLLDDDADFLPDPRSRGQGVWGSVDDFSHYYDPSSFAWSDQRWPGRALAGSVVYELHVGTFTPEGTLEAAAGKLEHLVSLGVDFVELMPVNGFDGTHNWGYDGVLWFAVEGQYGGPGAYQRFVNECHVAGIGVIQDVVYNHLGPSGSFLSRFGPYLTTGRNTWGDLVNLDGEGSAEVRRYILDNVRMWLADYHVDGLRLDAVHALQDSSPAHLLAEMSAEVDVLSDELGRPLTLVAESDLNDPVMVTAREQGGYGLDAQWSDDFHHALHVALTGETHGYYADFAPLSALVKVCERGFFHDGTWSSFRERDHGAPIDPEVVPPWRLVVCSQNHDQIGNRAAGDRLTEALDDDQLACAALVTMCAPFTPMLFQGEEWAASTPFQFFTSHTDPEIGRATSEGRMSEFARHGWDADTVPDPQDEATYHRSKLDWSELSSPRGHRMLAVYGALAALRREHPDLTEPTYAECRADEDSRVFTMGRGALTVVVNFGEQEQTVSLGAGELLFETESGVDLANGTVTLPRHAGCLVRSRQ